MKLLKPVLILIGILTVILVVYFTIAVSRPRVDAFLVSMQRTDYVDVEEKYPDFENLVSIEFRFEIVNRGRVSANYAVFSDDFERIAIGVNNDTNAYPHYVESNKVDHCRITYLLEDNEETRELNLNSFFVFCRKSMADPALVEKYRWARWVFSILGVRHSRIRNL